MEIALNFSRRDTDIEVTREFVEQGTYHLA
jgi:hypothetical protein